jgi:PAS domain S-box-containing protein
MGAVDFIQKSEPLVELTDRLLAAVGANPVSVEMSTDTAGSLMLDDHLERFRAAFDQAAIGMATMTLTGRIVRANTALERLIGAPPGGMVGTLFSDLADDEHVSALNGAIMRVASGVIDADNVTHRIATTRGLRWVFCTVAVARDPLGTPLYLFLQVQDVTDRHAAEEDLRLSEERFRLLVESVGDYAIFMLDPHGRIASWNRGAQRIKGYDADDVIGRHFEIFYTDDQRTAKHPDHELEIARAEGRYEEEGWRVRKDGSQFWASVVITAVRDAHGELVGFAKVTRDITDRRLLLEAREQTARERMEFLAVAAHELRGPVALVTGFAEMVNKHWRELDDAERDEMTDTLVGASQRLRRLVEDLLTASRLEAGGLEVRPQEIDLAPALRQAVSERASTARDVVFDLRCPSDLRVLADAGRLQQMLGNYIGNALRYGEAPFAVTAERRGPNVEIAVVDSGPGVGPEVMSRLFEKFSHGSDADSTGLGLFIVRELARAQGGDATYESPSTGGARFVLRLPAVHA